MSGNAKDLADQTIHYPELERHIKQTVQLTVREIQQRFSALLEDTGDPEVGGAPEAVRCLNVIFNHDSSPESSSNLAEFGEKEIDFLLSFFRRILLRYIYLTDLPIKVIITFYIAHEWNGFGFTITHPCDSLKLF